MSIKLFAPHLTDFYKTGHIFQFPEGTSFVYSNFTPRSSKLAVNVLPDFDNKVVFYGLQGTIKWLLIDLWNESFFNKPKEWAVAKYKRRMDYALGVGAVTVDHIAALHDLGYLPIKIKALKEGSRVNIRVPLWTISNTKDEFFWVTNYLESQLSTEAWKPIHTATTAFEYRRLLNRYADMTGSPLLFTAWQGHGFEFRGMSGVHDGTINGSAHLLSFFGTDTVSSLDYAEDYYGANAETEMLAGSVPATEHAVMCMGGKGDEIGTIRRLIVDKYPAGIVSIVSDTWNFWQVITGFAKTLKPEIMARKIDALGNAKVVFRPDSGDPVKIIAGDPEAEPGSPEFKGAVECLWEIFGGTTTSTGHKLLDSHVGVIYGDSITLQRAYLILEALHKKGFASANVVFGIGSFTYQMATRDSFGCAIKATFGVVNGEDRMLFKDPITDHGSVKKSAEGLLRVEFDGKDFILYDKQTREQEKQGLMEDVFCDGVLLRDELYGDIRMRLLG